MWNRIKCFIGLHDWAEVDRPDHPGRRRMCMHVGCLARQEQYREGFSSEIAWRYY